MPNTSSDEPKLHPSRRAILKTGAHAAWAVPAIQIASAAPSFAANSGIPGPAMLTVSGSGSRNGNNTTYSLTVANQAGLADANSVTVTITGSGIDYDSDPTNVSAGWTFNRNRFANTLTFTRTGTVASGTSATLGFRVRRGDTSGSPARYRNTAAVAGQNAAPATGAANHGSNLSLVVS
jgi:hypothetical protein